MTSDNEKMLEDDLLREIIDEFKSISESQDGVELTNKFTLLRPLKKWKMKAKNML